MKLNEILRTSIGEEFCHIPVSDTLTLIGESQDGGLLIEWSDGEIESVSVDKWNDLKGYEIVHISDAQDHTIKSCR
jgi:hypothetical protein